jgi:hypothetical protein
MKRNSKPASKWRKATLYPAANRETFAVNFRDPRSGGKRVNRGLGMSDRNEAQRICNDLDRLLNNADFWNIKHPAIPGLHPKAVEIFFDGAAVPTSTVDITVQVDFVKPFNEEEIASQFDEVVVGFVKPEELAELHAKYEN